MSEKNLLYAFRFLVYTFYHSVLLRQHFVRHLNAYRKNQWKDKDYLLRLQHEKSINLMVHCMRNVPYYRKMFRHLGIREKDLRTKGNLSLIPLLTKEEIRINYYGMIAENIPSSEVRNNSTSGSTGESLFFLTDHSRERGMCRDVIKLITKEWCNVSPFAKRGSLWGASFDAPPIETIAGKLRCFFRPHLFISAYNLSQLDMAKAADKLKKFKPDLLTSYPSPLEHFCRFCMNNRIKFPSIKAIICSAEQLFDHQRELFTQAFGVPVYNRYGCREFGDIAMECDRHAGLHILTDRVFLEVVRSDGFPCEYDEIGEIVITDLDNYAMPFLRYRIGDLGCLTNNTCSCGRGYPMLKKIQGRVFDLVHTPSGRTISGTFWTLLTRFVSKKIKAFQIVQENIDCITVKIQTFCNRLSNNEENLLKRKIFEVAPDLVVSIEYVEEIPLTHSGKRKFVIGLKK